MAEASDDACLQEDEMGFPLYFQKYEKSPGHDRFGRNISYWILWNADNEEPEHPTGFSSASSELKEKIKVLLERFMRWNASTAPSILIQFWEPVLIEGRTLLTTRLQHFAINSIQEGLCRYRIMSERFEVDVDEWHNKDELGHLGRVFIHKLPEFSPNIEYYTVKEYPQRQDALDCQITCVNALPVLDPSRQTCIGVLEVASSRNTASIVFEHPDYDFSPAEGVDLKIPGAGIDCFYKEIGDDYRAYEVAKKKMSDALEKVCEAHELDLAQMWAVCSDCMSNASYTGQVISRIWPLFYMKDGEGCSRYDPKRFLSISETLHMRDGQGVVGQALSSHGLIFCPDITQFSIVEYPLAHFAKLYGLQSCFAICLQSCTCTGSYFYVLEFFLPSSPIVNKNVINLLRNILRTMKLHFKTFKLASGKDLGENLPIQVVEYHNGEKYNCYTLEEESQITPQSPRGTLQDEGEIVQQDPSSQQPIDKVANAAQSTVHCTSSRGNGTSKILKRPQSETGIQLSLNDILPHAKKKIAEAAKALNVSRSTLKRICRDHNINRWPPRNLEENCSVPQADDGGQQILHSSYGMPSSSSQVLPTIAPTNSHDTMMPDVSFVNVKAVHENDVIKFELLSSSSLGMADLQHEIIKRLKLVDGTYDIKYKDEDDLVSIKCDEDVRYWIRTCGSQGSNSLKVFLLAK